MAAADVAPEEGVVDTSPQTGTSSGSGGEPGGDASASASSAADLAPDDTAAAADADSSQDDDTEDDKYVPPPQVDVADVRKAGDGSPEDDESLKRYKESLLGAAGTDAGKSAPLSVSFGDLVVSHPSVEGGGPKRGEASELGPKLVLALGDPEKTAKLGAEPFTVLQGGWRRVSVSFQVKGQIVHGLKLVISIFGDVLKRRLDQFTLMLGSYAPKPDWQHYGSPPRQYPSGMLARGGYLAQCKFVDDHGHEHLSFSYRFRIGKAWQWDHPATVAE